MYSKLNLVTGDTWTQARAAHFETQFDEGVDQTLQTPAISTGTLTLNLALGRVFLVAFNADITSLVFQNVPTSRLVIVSLRLRADGNNRAVTWPASVRAPGNVFPDPADTNGKDNWYALQTVDGGTTWDLFVAGENL